jgi:predicted nucleic acid-binding protein
MLAVSNTSPISNLALIGRLELLQLQCGEVLIPSAVEVELRNHPDATALLRAKHTGQIEAIRPEIGRLRSLAHFFIAPALEATVLTLAIE